MSHSLIVYNLALLIILIVLDKHSNVPKCKEMDTSILKIYSPYIESTQISVYYQYKQCINCEKMLLANMNSSGKTSKLLTSNYDFNFMVILDLNNGKHVKICEDFDHVTFTECGLYKLVLNSDFTCAIKVLEEPISKWIALIPSCVFLILVFRIYNSIEVRDVSRKRINSVDAFRGFSLFLMVFFNYGSGGYKRLQHADWHGLTIADLVYPWFIWIMGFNIPISIKAFIGIKKMSKLQVMKQILIRSLELFVSGILVFSIIGPNEYVPSRVRIPGVLQRIAVCYFIVATCELFFYKQSSLGNSNENKWTCLFNESWKQYLIMLVLSVIWLLITLYLKVPGCPKGYLEPGGLLEHSKFFNCTGGAAGYIDRFIFGENHLYRGGNIKRVFGIVKNFDPEGLLGTLTAIVLTYLGAQASKVTLLFTSKKKHLIIWFGSALILLGLFYALTGFKFDHSSLPVNKNLWTLSFTLITGCSAFCCMGMFYYLIDVKFLWSGKPFIYLGMNSIFIYLMHYLFRKTFPVFWRIVPNTHDSKLVMNLWGAFFWLFVSIFLHNKNIYFKF